MARLMRFKLLQGRHQGIGVKGAAKNYEKGDIIESEDELHKLFPNKFKRLPDSHLTTAKKQQDEEEQAKEEEEEEETAAPTALGKDVTSKFQNAKEVGVKVFQKKTDFYVTSIKDEFTPLNKESLKKQEVGIFIENMVEDDEVEPEEEAEKTEE